MKYNISKFPKYIEIQFQNRCNSNCLVCPYKDMNYNPTYMSDENFNKFLSEIKDSSELRIIPYLNNEPFLENDYIDKIRKIRSKCSNLEIEISTNVHLLNENKIENLSEMNITELRLSVFGYSDEVYKKMMPGLNKRKVFKNLRLISDKFKNTNTIVSIIMIDTSEISEIEFQSMADFAKKLGFKFERWGFLDRSQNVTYKSNNISRKDICGCEQDRPLERMHILANGDVILCCQDWGHTVVLGNIGVSTIEEIWNSHNYNEIREKIYNKYSSSPLICEKCKLAIIAQEET